MDNKNEKQQDEALDLNDIQVKFTGFHGSNQATKALQGAFSAINSTANLHRTIQNIFAANEKVMQDLIKGMGRFELPSMFIYPSVFQTPVLEVEEKNDIQPVKTPRKRPSKQRLQLGFYLLNGNSFEFKHKVLKSFSLDTQPGKLLHMFLHADGYYLADKELLSRFKKDDIREFGFILRNLKYAMRDNGLNITIDRRRKSKGYVLVDIAELQSNQE